jgi:hypothetical protein
MISATSQVLPIPFLGYNDKSHHIFADEDWCRRAELIFGFEKIWLVS